MKWLSDYKMNLMLVGIAAGIVFGGGRANADYTWMQKADMPTPRWTQTSAAVNGKIYVIGGATSEPDWKCLSTVEEYDPASDTWTRKTDMPTARIDFVGSSAVVDGKIYVIGGWDGSTLSIVEEYDPATDTWERKSDMPTRRCSLATVAVDGKIYAIGGLVSWGSLVGLRTVEEYNPATDTWARKADMPRGVWGLCASVASGKIYAMGGRQSTSAKPYVQEYDPATDTWTQKADMPIGTSQMGSVVLGNKIVVMGGWYWSAEQPYTTVQMYDLETDTWTIEADVPFQRAVFSADVLNNRIYAIGGTDKSHPCPALSTVYEFGPKPPDFNVDGIIDATDVCIMVDHWGDNYPLCDIAPLPFGDSIVDIQDLIVLSEYLFTDLRIFVDDDALNDPAPGEPLISDPLEDGSSDHPFDSIQEAIDAASFGPGCVVILPGTYTGEGNYDITFEGKAITVRSIDPNDSAIVASTVIDCQGTQDVRRKGFIFNKGESAQSVLDGLTITNAHAGYICGGGINCTVSSPTISRCVLRNNKATQRGGGMYIASGSPVVSNCIFSGNTAADGGALYNIGNALVLNCTFTRNLATSGGKIHNLGGTLTLNNCILWDYTTPEIRVGGGTVSVTYSDIRGGFTGEGNINVDPLFADPANGDYHLKSHAGCWDPLSENWVIDDVTSPCIDAGDPSSPVADEPESNGGRINMGAYGGTTEASKSP